MIDGCGQIVWRLVGWARVVVLGPPWLVRLVRRQQPNCQFDQLKSIDYDSSLVPVLAHLVVLPLSEGGVVSVAHSDAVGRLAEAVPQVPVSVSSDTRILSLETSALASGRVEARELGELGLYAAVQA